MIGIKTQNSDEFSDLIRSMVVGKTVKYIEYGKSNTTLYAKNPEDEISRVYIYFTDGSRLSFAQDTSPIDDEEEHEEQPLVLTYGK